MTCMHTILLSLLVLIVLYIFYQYMISRNSWGNESFNDTQRIYNSRQLSAQNARRVMLPAQWRDFHRGEADIHPVEF